MAKARASVRGRGQKKEQTQRQLRVGEMLRHTLAGILARGDVSDPGLTATPITVTEVRASPDLRNATAFVTPLGGQGGDELIAALERNAAYLRGQVSRQVSLKFSPQLSFQLDHSFDYAAHIDGLLKDVDGNLSEPMGAPRPEGGKG
ncbi:MAG TPA: 30S ribosome-binding factor RbfA [Sneathiellales bacterium]|nr:30S ribosome-binding factor RbfA [Sneathiellales bacterium]